MIKSEHIETLPVSSAQLDEISGFIASENADENIQSAYLKWWYFKNPIKSWSFFKILVENKIGGIATTNNFIFSYNNLNVKVAMPQKVLTAKSMRGKGLFSKAYFSSEEYNIEDGIDFFLTFTNAASTPIFINKFNYSVGQAPKLFFSPSLPHHLFLSSNCEVVDDINRDIYDGGLISAKNSIVKNEKHIQWRYLSFNPSQYIILEFKNDGAVLGYCILKDKSIKGLKALMLMDIVTNRKESIKPITKGCRWWASKRGYLGLLFLQNELIQEHFSGLYFNTFKHFNFLVKGSVIHRQEQLAKEKFNFFLGDLDFL